MNGREGLASPLTKAKVSGGFWVSPQSLRTVPSMEAQAMAMVVVKSFTGV